MVLEKKNILIVSPEPWTHVFVSKHHYAVHLARLNNRVFFLQPPTQSNNVEPTGYAGVHVISYSGFIRGLRFFPSLIQKALIKRKYRQLEILCGATFDVVWSFDNSVFFDFTALPSKVVKISHIVDLNQNFQFKKAARTADLCFCTTDRIKDRLLKYNNRVFKVHHGFNFRGLPDQVTSMPGRSTIKIVYAGNLAMDYLDWVLVGQVVKKFRDADFIFIGPNRERVLINKDHEQAKNDVMAASNSYFLGKKNSEELLSYLSIADVLIVCYQEDFQADQANPHKMMEYFGVGKMIVATNTEEYRPLATQKLFLMSNRNAEFADLLKKAISNLEFWNSEELRRRRVAYAMKHTYFKNLEKIENHIRSIVDPSRLY